MRKSTGKEERNAHVGIADARLPPSRISPSTISPESRPHSALFSSLFRQRIAFQRIDYCHFGWNASSYSSLKVTYSLHSRDLAGNEYASPITVVMSVDVNAFVSAPSFNTLWHRSFSDAPSSPIPQRKGVQTRSSVASEESAYQRPASSSGLPGTFKLSQKSVQARTPSYDPMSSRFALFSPK